MLNAIIDSLETKYYAVFHDLTYREISSLQAASELKPDPYFLIKKENKARVKSIYNDDFFAISAYSLYDKKLNAFQVKVNGWSLLDIYEPEQRRREVRYQISDPSGITAVISNLDLNPDHWTEYFQIEGIVKIIALIRKISKHSDWSFYNLLIENKGLKVRNEEMAYRIKSLENQLKRLEESDN